jgi:primary-amine oxidase
VVSYLDTGDGNYWAHPIENLVAVVDLEQKKIIKIEEGPVIPVPMESRPYDGRDRVAAAVKPLDITEPEGKNYTITGDTIHWQNWDFHLRLNSRVGPILSTVTYNDNGQKRQVMYEGSLGGMIVPYGDPDVGWYFKAYLDSGDYGMGTLTSPIVRGKDAPANSVLLDETIADYTGAPTTIPHAIAIFERYAGPEYKHQEMGNRTSAPSAASWWCAGSVPSATTTISLTGCSTRTAPSASMPAPPESKRSKASWRRPCTIRAPKRIPVTGR